MSWDCGRKPEHQMETQADRGRACRLHTETLQSGSNPGSVCCEATVLAAKTPCSLCLSSLPRHFKDYSEENISIKILCLYHPLFPFTAHISNVVDGLWIVIIKMICMLSLCTHSTCFIFWQTHPMTDGQTFTHVLKVASEYEYYYSWDIHVVSVCAIWGNIST